MSQFDTFYSCPTYNGAGIRYRISVMCQFLVQQSQCQQPSPVTPLCQDACSTFTASQSKIMSNSTLCPTNVTADITTRRSTLLSASSNPYVNFCTLLQPKSANPSCSMGVPYEALQCGKKYNVVLL